MPYRLIVAEKSVSVRKIIETTFPDSEFSIRYFGNGDELASELSNLRFDAVLINVFIPGKNGYEIAGEAENGLKAIEKYKELAPDLVLMDITMPEMDGIEAVKNIKSIDPSAKIVMCSAMGQQAMVIESIQAGARDFIVKPFQQERVLEAVRKVVG